MDASKKRILYFDLLNLMACFAVVVLHVNIAYWSFRSAPSWVLNTFLFASFYWAVPVFYMLTGAKLLASFRWGNLRGYLKKRFLRGVLPFIAWSVIGLAFGLYVTGYIPSDESFSYYLGLIVSTSMPTESILWFMVPLFSIYLAIPLLAFVPENVRPRVYAYLLVVYFAIDFLNQLFRTLGAFPNGDFVWPLGTAWFVYPVLGYLIAHCEFDKRQRWLVYFLGAVSWGLIFVGTLAMSFHAGSLVRFASDGIGLPSVSMASAVFLAVREWSECHPAQLNRMGGMLRGGVRLTFGVYLTHMFVLTLLVRIADIQEASWWWGIFGIPVVFSLSMALSALLNRIPVLRRIV